MIDFHSHILPGIDDGAKDINISIGLLNELRRQSVFDVVFTPHYYSDSLSITEFLTKRDGAFNLIKEYMFSLNMKFFLGAEVYLTKYLLNNPKSEIEKLCINNSRYLLLEMPFDSTWHTKTIQMVENLMYSNDIIPIIAHIERYPAIKQNFDFVDEFIQLGCLIQVNTESIIASGSKKLVSKLLKKECVHVLGSDAHNLKTRPPIYIKPLQKIVKIIGESGLETIKQNGIKIINNEIINDNSNDSLIFM